MHSQLTNPRASVPDGCRKAPRAMGMSIGGIKAQLTAALFSADGTAVLGTPTPAPPGRHSSPRHSADNQCVRDSLPEQGACPEGSPPTAWARQPVVAEGAAHQRSPRPVARCGFRRVARLGARARDRRRRAMDHHTCPPAAMRRQYAVVDHQIGPRPRNQRRQLLQQRERLEEQAGARHPPTGSSA
jgi:hypothetical protein